LDIYHIFKDNRYSKNWGEKLFKGRNQYEIQMSQMTNENKNDNQLSKRVNTIWKFEEEHLKKYTI